MSELAREPAATVDLHFILPGDIDDPGAPSGGNVYDRRLSQGLAALGWRVCEHAIPGAWPLPLGNEPARLAQVLAALPDDALVLLDGLVASAAPQVLVPEAARLRQVILVHQLPQQAQVLSAAVAVVTTSEWSRRRVLDRYGLPGTRVHAAPPGVDAAPLVLGSGAGSRLLCVAAVAPHKGHDVLIQALGTLTDLPWSCVCAGSLQREPGFAERLRAQLAASGIAGRVKFPGPLTSAQLAATYAAADLLVLPSRGETYGMVVTEALARGMPVLATAADGIPEALGRAPDGSLPGLLVAGDDPGALAAGLRDWLADAELRNKLRQSARDRRTTLAGWPGTARRIASVLADYAAPVWVR